MEEIQNKPQRKQKLRMFATGIVCSWLDTWQEGSSSGDPENFRVKQAEDGCRKTAEFCGMICVCRKNRHLTLSLWRHWRQTGKTVAQEHIHLCGILVLLIHCVTHKGSAPQRSTTFLYRLTQVAGLALCDLLYMRYTGRRSNHGHD